MLYGDIIFAEYWLSSERASKDEQLTVVFLYVWRRYAKPSARYAVALMISGEIFTEEEAGSKRGRHLSEWTDMRS